MCLEYCNLILPVMRHGGIWATRELAVAGTSRNGWPPSRPRAQSRHKASTNTGRLSWKNYEKGLAHSKDRARRAAAEEKPVGRERCPRRPYDLGQSSSITQPEHRKVKNVAVRLLGQIDSPGSSRALAFLALLSRSAEVRSAATQVLRQRDPRDFASVLIALMRDPIKYEVRRVNGPGSQGQLLVKQKDCCYQCSNGCTRRRPLPHVPLMPGDRISSRCERQLPVLIRELGQYQTPSVYVGNTPAAAVPALIGLSQPPSPASIAGDLSRAGVPAGLSQTLGDRLSRANRVPVLEMAGTAGRDRIASEIINRQLDIPVGQMMVDAQMSARAADQQLANDVQSIENYNAPIVEMNASEFDEVLT